LDEKYAFCKLKNELDVKINKNCFLQIKKIVKRLKKVKIEKYKS
jgi:hypothetical protein